LNKEKPDEMIDLVRLFCVREKRLAPSFGLNVVA